MYVGKQLATCNFSGHICTSIPLPVGITNNAASFADVLCRPTHTAGTRPIDTRTSHHCLWAYGSIWKLL